MTDEDFDPHWLNRRCAALGIAPLDDEQIDALLSLAGNAAHDSGDRRNAPLTCFLVGLHLGSTGGTADGASIGALPT